tara:strand:+ start:3649 stop:4191 length:543 start_codon:yes stop_codon:yes gene_type:complete
MNLLYCNNINGEGSSIVSLALIKAFLVDPTERSVLVTSKRSVLSDYLLDLDGQVILDIFGFSLIHLSIRYPNNFHLMTPQWTRNNIFATFVKLIFPVFLFQFEILTMDDYPFLQARKQVLFFQQSNLLDAYQLKWRLRKALFYLLCISKPVVFLQTPFTEQQFKKNFPHLNTFSMVIDYD